MRNIKFRVWNAKEQVYCYFSKPDCHKCHHVWLQIEGGLTSVNFNNPNIEHYILEQCTGLRDGRKFEIYEGDIIKIRMTDTLYGYGEVFWEAPSFKLKYKCHMTKNDIVVPLCSHYMKLCEVVGTIHQLPNLLTYDKTET